MENLRAILALLLLQSYTLITLAASLPPTLSIINANISLASLADPPVNRTLYRPSGPYVIHLKSQGSVTISHFDGAFVRTDFHTYNLWHMFEDLEGYARAAVLSNSTVDRDRIRWEENYKSSERHYFEIGFSLPLLPTMTYEHMLWAMEALKDWVKDKTVKGFSCRIDAEGVGVVGYGSMRRDDYIPGSGFES